MMALMTALTWPCCAAHAQLKASEGEKLAFDRAKFITALEADPAGALELEGAVGRAALGVSLTEVGGHRLHRAQMRLEARKVRRFRRSARAPQTSTRSPGTTPISAR